MLDQKTLDFLDELKKHTNPVSATQTDPADILEPTTPKPFLQQAAETVASAPSKVTQAGGQLLMKTVSNISAVGNYLPAFIRELERSEFGRSFGMQENGEYVNAGQFNLRGFGNDLKEAASNAYSNSVSVANSKNLGELAENAVSGAEVLKGLPGQLGEAFRQNDTRTKTGTAILGFALELMLDPSSKLAGIANTGIKGVDAANKLGQGLTRTADAGGLMAPVAGRLLKGLPEIGVGTQMNRLQEAGKISPRVARVLTRGAQSAALNNLDVGMGVMALRETSAFIRENLIKVSDKVTDPTAVTTARKALETFYGPLAAARDEFRPLANQLMSLRQELPKQMQKSAGMAAVFSQTLPKGVRQEARELLSIVVANPRHSEEGKAAYEELVKLGVSPERIDSVSSQFYKANQQIISFMDEAGQHVKGLEGIKYDPKHLSENYYIHADRRTQATWIQYLIARDNPGNWLISNMGIKAELEARLGIPASRLDEAVPVGPKNSNTWTNPTVQDAINAGMATTKENPARGFANAYQRPEVTKAISIVDNVMKTDGQEAATKATAKIMDGYQQRLKAYQNQIDEIDYKIESLLPEGSNVPKRNTPLGKAVYSYTVRRNNLIAKYDDLMDTTTQISNSLGFDAANIGSKTPGRINPETGNPMFGSRRDLMGNKATQDLSGAPGVTGAAEANTTAFTPGKVGADTAKIKKSPIAMDGSNQFDLEARKEYIEGLVKFANVDRPFNDTLPKIAKFEPDGGISLEYDIAKPAARTQTMAHLIDFTDNFFDGKGINVTDSVRSEVNKALQASLKYVHGDKEFAYGLKGTKDVFQEAGKMRQWLIDAGIYDTDALRTAAVAEPYVDDIFKPLLGQIKEFPAAAALQADKMSDLAADAIVQTEMKKRGLVLDAAKFDALPDKEKKLWQEVDWYQGGEKHFANIHDVSTINAINKALSGDTMGIPKGLMWASSLFKRAVLFTNPASHVTQLLGNLALLKMSGYGDLISDTPMSAKAMRKAYTAILSNDELAQDAAKAGVTISANMLEGVDTQSILRHHLTQPKHPDMKNTLSNIVNSIHSIGQNATEGAKATGMGRAINVIEATSNKTPTEAYDTAAHKLSLSARYQMSDQLIRMYAYEREVSKGVAELTRANPQLKGWIQKNSGLIDMESLTKYHESEIGKSAPIFASDDLAELQTAYREIREQAAIKANDVGLNMADLPRYSTYLSRSGVVPFMNFTGKATGRTLQWMEEKPWAFTPFYTGQRNMNEALNMDPDNLGHDLETMPESVRNGLVVPTLETNEQGKPLYQDIARFLPFGMYANGGAQPEPGAHPNAAISVPMADVVSKLITQEGRRDDQSYGAYVAGVLANTFSPAVIGPGSPQLDAIARSIEANTFTIEDDGTVVPREQSKLDKFVTAYTQIPEQIGNAVLPMGEGTALGNPNPNEALRSRTTPDVAYRRLVQPGFGQAPDTELTVLETGRRIDSMINQLKAQANSYNNKQYLTPEDGQRIEAINQRIEQLELYKGQKSYNLTVGE